MLKCLNYCWNDRELWIWANLTYFINRTTMSLHQLYFLFNLSIQFHFCMIEKRLTSFIIQWHYMNIIWWMHDAWFNAWRFATKSNFKIDFNFKRKNIFIDLRDEIIDLIDSYIENLLILTTKKWIKRVSFFFRAIIFLFSKSNRNTNVIVFAFTFTIMFNQNAANKIEFLIFSTRTKKKYNTITNVLCFC